MDVKQLLKAPPLLHDAGDGNLTSWQLPNRVLEFIEGHVNENSKTVETGSGLSTIIFAIKRCHHTCVVHQQGEVDRIKEFLSNQQIPSDRLTFVVGSSDRMLPRIEFKDLDFVLIDGGHGFPLSFIDWHYTAPYLKVGGKLIIDNTELWTCDVLKDFLIEEPAWKLECEFPGWTRTAVFTKVQETGPYKEWCFQPYVVRRSDITALVSGADDLSWVAGLTEWRIAKILLRHGRPLKLLRRVWRRLKGG